MDPEFPTDRLAMHVEDSQAQVVITSKALRGRAEALTVLQAFLVRMLCLDGVPAL